jgi:hypothetical protein
VLLKNIGVLLKNLDSMCRPVEIARPVFGQRNHKHAHKANSLLLNFGKGVALLWEEKIKAR